MNVHTCPLDGILLLELERHEDERGFLAECFESERYRAIGICDAFVQENHSRSRQHVLRGMHFTRAHPQAQLVTVLRGHIYDVVVDIRPHSATFGAWFATHLTDNGPCQVYMPHGFAHGFCVLSESADVHYKVTQPYRPQDHGGLLWNDASVGIEWPVSSPIVSSNDRRYAGFDQFAQSDNAPRFRWGKQ